MDAPHPGTHAGGSQRQAQALFALTQGLRGRVLLVDVAGDLQFDRIVVVADERAQLVQVGPPVRARLRRLTQLLSQ